MSFDKSAYTNAYNKEKYLGVSFRINRISEKDIADALKDVTNMKEYICRLIRADVKRKQRRAGWAVNRGDKKIHQDYKRYPFEVIEMVGFNDRYTVGFAEDLDAANMMLSYYAQKNEAAGPLAIYHRFYDDTVKAVCSVQVVD